MWKEFGILYAWGTDLCPVLRLDSFHASSVSKGFYLTEEKLSTISVSWYKLKCAYATS